MPALNLLVPPRRHLYVLYPRLWPITANNIKLKMEGPYLVEEVDVGVSAHLICSFDIG